MTWKCIFEGNRSRGRKDYFNCGDKAVPFLFLSVQVCLSRRGDDGLGNFLSCSCRQDPRLFQLQRLEKCIPILVRSSKNDSPLPPLSERNAAEIWIMRGMFLPFPLWGWDLRIRAESAQITPRGWGTYNTAYGLSYFSSPLAGCVQCACICKGLVEGTEWEKMVVFAPL